MSNQTRRSWMVTIGQAAVGLELSGKARQRFRARIYCPGPVRSLYGSPQPRVNEYRAIPSCCSGLPDRLRPPADRSVQAFIFLCIRIHDPPAFNGIDARER